MDQEKLIGLLEALKEKAENPCLKDEIDEVIKEVKSADEKKWLDFLTKKNKKLLQKTVTAIQKVFIHAGYTVLAEELIKAAEEILRHLRQLF